MTGQALYVYSRGKEAINFAENLRIRGYLLRLASLLVQAFIDPLDRGLGDLRGCLPFISRLTLLGR